MTVTGLMVTSWLTLVLVGQGRVTDVSRCWSWSSWFCLGYRRTSLVRVAIVIFLFVVLIYTFSRTTQRVLPVRKLAKEGDVGLVESADRAKHFVLPDLPEKRHIVYIRIPKTGSSTTTVLIWRYAWTRNLSVLAVRPGYDYTQPRLTSKQYFLPSPGNQYDVMANHVFYDKETYAPYFHNDTLYLAQLREPMSMLHSSVYYFKSLMEAIPGEDKDKVRNYLQHPERYDGISPSEGWSFTKNPQSAYLGLQKHDFDSMVKIQERIQTTEKDFPLVMILEKLDESLILFRRITHWPMKDLIYNAGNINRKKPNLRMSLHERQIYRNWSLADHLFYDYFLEKLDKQIAEAGSSFQNELELFQRYRSEVANYCRFETIPDNVLSIAATPYNGGFTFSRNDCSLMQVEGPRLISALRKRQNVSPYLAFGLK